jgi:hypothetical protein
MSDDQSKTTRPELAPLDCPIEVSAFLKAGDVLAMCLPGHWRLVRADVRVAAEVIPVLRGGGYLCGPRLGGRLAPLGDGLPGIMRTGNALAQTYGWAEDRSDAVH